MGTLHERLQSWGLHNALATIHPELPMVATCNKNLNNTPIDGIWATPGIDILQGGMTGFGTPGLGPTDHRLLWIDVDEASIFGFKIPHPEPIVLTGLPLQDPLIIKCYNNLLQKKRNFYRIPHIIFAIEVKAHTHTISDQDLLLYDRILETYFTLQQQCINKVRKKYAGKVPYSDVIGKRCKEIYLWSLVKAHWHHTHNTYHHVDT